MDATNVTVTGLADQMTDIQRNIADMRLAIENLTAQQQQDDDEDPELEDDAHNARGAPRGHRPRGWVPLGRNGRGQDEEDGLGKPKFSIPKFEGGADVEEYLTWELKIEKLWSLHPHYSEDRKIKLASSEFDGYALRWWDSLVRNLDEDGAQPIRTWRAMKEAMTSRFVPTNYMRNIFDKLTLLRQGVKTVDEYYMEMEMLMQRGRVRESLEMTMQRFLNGLNWLKKQRLRDVLRLGVLHPVRPLRAGAFDAFRSLLRLANRSPMYLMQRSPNLLQASGSSMSTTRNRDMLCHTCGGKGHFKRDCPNRKVMFINEDNEYETGDDVDPNAPDDDDYDTDGEDAYPSDARTIVVSQRALNVLPSASTQRCNLFQTKALVGPDKACKVIIDGGSCRNLASKELCTKLKLKYLPHPHPYYIQWLSDNGEMKTLERRVDALKGGDDEDIPTSLLPPSLPTEDEPAVKLKYEEETSIERGGEEQLDVKMDVKLDMELDMKISHGRAREAGGMRERRRRSPAVQNPVKLPPRGRDPLDSQPPPTGGSASCGRKPETRFRLPSAHAAASTPRPTTTSTPLQAHARRPLYFRVAGRTQADLRRPDPALSSQLVELTSPSRLLEAQLVEAVAAIENAEEVGGGRWTLRQRSMVLLSAAD
ncbi:hypothetical protein QYE76_020937 [Lolium multiflorum]|uniref:CCHC-type domain-containing protein n=1 Tax=Lolium multiflorum TaxID=4521 RepID=A0AAD8R5T0_LOLMU|nr:hypothetical protein QYE76_020937 [Lolium multiflorum]